MIGRLIDVLREIDPEVTPTELSDAVWLLAELSRRVPALDGQDGPPPESPSTSSSTSSSARPDDETREPGDAASPSAHRPPGPGSRQGAARLGADLMAGATVADPEPMAEWHLPMRGRLLDPPGWLPARSPGADDLPATLAAGRALRSLHRRVPSRTARELDDEATARLAAEQGLWLPVPRPLRDRWLDLVVVVDVSASMAIWRHQVAGLRSLLEHLGAFRDVRCYYVDGDATDRRLVLRSEAAGGSGSGHDPGELVDPTRRRAVLVVSDCVGAAWDGGAMTQALREWGRAGPVAVVQMLPQRLWPACRPELRTVRLRTLRRGAANSELEVLAPVGADGPVLPDGAVPVPILELQPRWLRPWADLVADPGPEPSMFTVYPVEARPPDREVQREIEREIEREVEPVALRPEEMLAEFRGQASKDALALVQWLAAAPLSLPVMRLVQQSMLPQAPPSVLAEVFLGGLLERQPRDVAAGDPDDVEYEFVDGVRECLLDGMPRHDQLGVLGEVSRFIAGRLGTPNDFPAYLAGETPESELVGHDRAFARVAFRVLTGLGGRYGELAAGLRPTGQAPVVAREGATADMQSFGPRDHEPAGTTVTRSVSVTTVEPDLFRQQDRPPTAPSSTSVATVLQRRVFGGVPLRNPHFTGRVELLERLHAMLRAGASHTALLPHALHGLGGVGKTQVAIEYAWRYAQEYDLVWWLRAESPTTLRQGFVDLARVIGLEQGDLSKTILNVLDLLQDRRTFPRWLVVLDNANAPEELEGYLPAFGNVLITSRNPEWAQVAEQVQVDVFSREESIALLQRRGAGIGAAEADRLAAQLGDLPLALDQAAAWQSATGAPVAELERLLAQRMAALMSEPPPANYPVSLMATWDLAFTELNQRAPGAARLLELLAFFGPEPIAVPLLQESRGADLPEPLGSVLRDEIKLRRAIREIGRYALAKPNAGRDEIEIHRLVQAVLRERLTPSEREATRDAVHRVIGAANPGYPDVERTWARHAELLPHITPSEVIFGHSEAGHRAALDQIRYRYVRGDYERSEALAQIALDAWRTALGADHELTLLAQRNLALTMAEAGHYDEAAELNQKTWARMRDVFGEDHEHTIATMRNVGRDLRLRGEYVEALRHDEDTWQRHRRVLGHDDPDTLRAMNNYGNALRHLGEAGAALELDRECLELRQQVLGPETQQPLHALANVARDLADAGRYAEAHTLLIEALPRIQRVPRGHRLAVMFYSVLVMVLRRSGASARAVEVAEENYQAAFHGYPAGHDYVLSAAMTFALARLAVGETAPARDLAENAWQGYRASFGPEHPSTLAAALDLAVVLRATGERQRALDLDRHSLEALRGQAARIGDDHPFLLVAMLNLAHDHALASDFAPALALSGEAYERSRRVRGEDHPETLVCGLNHALDLRATGDQARAQELFERVQIVLRRDYGEQHPAVQAAARLERAEADIEHWET